MTFTSASTPIRDCPTGPAAMGRKLGILAALVAVSIGLLVGCGEALDSTEPRVGAVTPARTPVSADAAERRAASVTRTPVSADAAERRAASTPTDTTPVSADAAERRAAELQAQLREIKDRNVNR